MVNTELYDTIWTNHVLVFSIVYGYWFAYGRPVGGEAQRVWQMVRVN
jgi:hypothetical protein